jgi:hypothetical protein
MLTTSIRCRPQVRHGQLLKSDPLSPEGSSWRTARCAVASSRPRQLLNDAARRTKRLAFGLATAAAGGLGSRSP